MQVGSARQIRRQAQSGLVALFTASFLIPALLGPELRAQNAGSNSKAENRNAKMENWDSARPSSMASHLSRTYARLPLSFEPNQGQAPRGVQFVSRGQGFTLALTGNEAVLALKRDQSSAL